VLALLTPDASETERKALIWRLEPLLAPLAGTPDASSILAVLPLRYSGNLGVSGVSYRGVHGKRSGLACTAAAGDGITRSELGLEVRVVSSDVAVGR
jgi:hypothetical protein